MRRYISFLWCLLLCLSCAYGVSFGQQQLALKSITTSDGLSQGMVYCMLQDRDGFLWIGTKEGLNRYDGYNFKVFTNDPYNKNSLSNNTVLAISEDSKGRLWIRTDNDGICIYDKVQGIFHRLTLENKEETRTNTRQRVLPIYELSDGRFIASSTMENGFHIFSMPEDLSNDKTVITTKWLSKPSSTQGFLQTMVQNTKGVIYLGYSDSSNFILHPDQMSFETLGHYYFYRGFPTIEGGIWATNRPAFIEGSHIYPLLNPLLDGDMKHNFAVQDKHDKLWLGVDEQLYCMDITGWQPSKPIDPRNAILSTSKMGQSIVTGLIDQSGVLWLGKAGLGLEKLVTSNILIKKVVRDERINNVQELDIANLKLPALSNLMIASKRDKNLPQFEYKRIKPKEAYSTSIIDKNGNYWEFSTNTIKLIRHDRRTQKNSVFNINISFDNPDNYFPMMVTAAGNFWIGGMAGNFAQVNPTTGAVLYYTIKNKQGQPLPPNSQPTALYQDAAGTIWAGTTTGFGKFQFTNNETTLQASTLYQNNISKQNSLSYNHVSCFLDDPTNPNYLWIATKGGGLNRFDKKTGDFIHLSTKQGLPNNVVYGILPDKAGNIWGSTNRGIFCLMTNKSINQKDWQIRNFSKSNGFASDEFNTGEYCLMPYDELAFGGVDGVNVFNPAELLEASSFNPKVFITNILVGNIQVTPNDDTGILDRTIEYAQSIKLNHEQDVLTLEFSALDFSAPEKNKYRYQLVGVDRDWIEAGTRRMATYMHLPSGNFTFKVQGSNSQGVWSPNITELKIRMMPPWWRSWWAYLSYGVLSLLCIRSVLRFYTKRAKLQTQLKYEQLEAHRVKELDTVKTHLYTNITHEFRTPLTVITGIAQQMQSDPEVMQGKGLEMILRNGQNLLDLVNEMLDLSKLETGKMHVHLVSGNLVNYLQYVVESFHSLAQSQHKQLHLLAGIEELYVKYDPEKLRQIIGNLLSNAIKFTPEKGNIYITVNQLTEANENNEVFLELKIKDTGIGIAEGQIEQIFERFFQIESKYQSEGTGIGLAITKELVKLLKGEITVKSHTSGPNKGTEFTVKLPFTVVNNQDQVNPSLLQSDTSALSHTERISPSNSNEQQSSVTIKPLVLLVEDNADVVAYTASCLSDYRLVVGKDGAEGLEIATELVPDLIVTDVMMPIMDGFELCKRLRAHELTSHIPIIMLTAKVDFQSKLEGIELGADAYLEKPFHREELIIRIKKLLEQRKNLQEYYLKNVGLIQQNTSTEEKEIVVIPEPKLPIDQEDTFIRKVKEAIEAHLSNENFSIEDLCKLVFMSHSQLHRKLNAVTGYSPNKFIRFIRLQKASEMLLKSSDSINFIAGECGYVDAGYFSRIFKQEFGVSPNEWRANNGLV